MCVCVCVRMCVCVCGVCGVDETRILYFFFILYVRCAGIPCALDVYVFCISAGGEIWKGEPLYVDIFHQVAGTYFITTFCISARGEIWKGEPLYLDIFYQVASTYFIHIFCISAGGGTWKGERARHTASPQR